MSEIELKIDIDIWGPMACFAPPYAKAERISYPVPTPAALRGVFDSIYSKPPEFWWSINRIEVMRPILYSPCMTNGVKKKMGKAMDPMDYENRHTQITTVYLRDVYYRVTATIHPKFPGDDFATSLRKQAIRRIEQGQCFRQPVLGMRECPCYFALSKRGKMPIQESQDFGLMVYDTHVPYDGRVGSDGFSASLYHCVMENGVINVPDYDSPQVLKIGGGLRAASAV